MADSVRVGPYRPSAPARAMAPLLRVLAGGARRPDVVVGAVPRAVCQWRSVLTEPLAHELSSPNCDGVSCSGARLCDPSQQASGALAGSPRAAMPDKSRPRRRRPVRSQLGDRGTSIWAKAQAAAASRRCRRTVDAYAGRPHARADARLGPFSSGRRRSAGPSRYPRAKEASVELAWGAWCRAHQ